jgi:hypothetical protein
MLSRKIVIKKPKHNSNNTSGKNVKMASQNLVEDFMIYDLNELLKGLIF